MADGEVGAAFTQEKTDGIQEQRLANPSFTGDDVQTGVKAVEAQYSGEVSEMALSPMTTSVPPGADTLTLSAAVRSLLSRAASALICR